jgi:hypothetical protein
VFVFQTTHRELYNAAKSDIGKKGTAAVASSKGQTTISFAAASASSSEQVTQKYSNSNSRQKAITEALIKLVADSMLPFQFVESQGFRKFMAVVDPKYSIPSRRTVTRKTTDKLQMIKDSIKHDLDLLAEQNLRIGTVHATTDLWSSRTLEPIIGVRFHYFDASFGLHVRTVAYRHFAERHTGENIATVFEKIVEEYGISAAEMGYQVTDNARNMLKAFEIFSEHAVAQLAAQSSANDIDPNPNMSGSDQAVGETDNNTDGEFLEFLADDDGTADDDSIVIESCRLPCVAHTLQLAIKDALKNTPFAVKLVDEASSVVVFFRRSLFWNAELKKLSGGLTLLADVPTRWNSSLIMLRRLSAEDVWKAVTETLFRAKTSKNPVVANVPRLTINRAQMLDFVTLLEPFEEATQALQGDGVTLSVVIPALVGIDDALACYNNTALPTLRRNLRKYLSNRFQELINRPEYIVATILDCRYKLVPFPDQDMVHSEESDENLDDNDNSTAPVQEMLQPPNRTDARRLLLQMLGAVTASGGLGRVRNPVIQESRTADQSLTCSSRKSIFSKFSVSQVVQTETEDTLYCNSPTDSEMLPDVYWAKMNKTYPRLAKLARTLLSIPASSGSVERLFSVSGAIVRARRSRLTTTTVESLLLAMECEHGIGSEGSD